ncbi:hypothetical protein CHUAL_006998 [Chamberlinius hualienensis]
MSSECIAIVKTRLDWNKVVYGLFVAAVIVHLGFLIQDYANCPDIEIATNSQKTNNKLPSLTICSNIPIRRNASYKDVKFYLTPEIEKLIADRESATLPTFTATHVQYILAKKNALTDYLHEKNCITRTPLREYPFNQNNESEFTLYTEEDYYYSTEACMVSCLQNLTIKYCRCQRPQFQIYNQLPICRGCNDIPQWELDACNCKPPCKYSKYGVKIETVKQIPSKINTTARSKALYYHLLKNHTVNGMMHSFGKYSFPSAVTIALPYESISVIKTESMCKVEIFLSQVGGILGTYAGLSILMIVNLIYGNGLKLLQHCKRAKENLISNKTDQPRKANEPTIGLFRDIVNYIKISNLPTKIIWVSIVFVGFYKTFDQGYQLIDDYYRYPVVQKVETIGGIQFPSVTVCSNSILVKNSTSLEKEMVLKKYSEIIKDLPQNTETDVYSTLKTYIQSLPVKIKKKFGSSIKNYIKSCHYKAGNEWQHCSYQNLYEHYNDLFGNCATFNPGFLNETSNNEFKPTELTMELQYEIQEFIEYVLWFGLLVFLHPKGTSPNLYQSQRNFLIQPGDHHWIKYSTVAIDHLPPPYPSDCVTTVTSTMLWKNNYYTHNSQYNYHHESCLSSGNYNCSAKVDAGLFELHRGRINPKEAEMMGNFLYVKNMKYLYYIFLDNDCQMPCSTVRHYVEDYARMGINDSKSTSGNDDFK